VIKTNIKLLVILALSLIAFAQTGCNKERDNKMTSEISTNIKELPLNLPYQPKAVWWQETRRGTPPLIVSFGPTDTIVDAVLLFDEKDLKAILKKSKPITPHVYSPSDQQIIKIIEQNRKPRELAPKSPEDIAYEAELHNLLKEHGELEDKTYEATLFTIRSSGRVVRIKGTNKLYVSYSTS
jgi:hypothetical protein